MNIHSDLSKNARVEADLLPWQDSSASGVFRKMIERTGSELARATSIVRYEAGSSFPKHKHDKGEEFLVLEGVFTDETGDYPKGMYVRNPPGSGHSPSTGPGCQILVKLRQIHNLDQSYVRVHTENGEWQHLKRAKVLPLHTFGSENVAMVDAKKGTFLWDRDFPRGLEAFVVKGRLMSDQESYSAGTWLRIAPGGILKLYADEDSVFFVKTGHLPEVRPDSEALPWEELL